jgi:hypothetical protein
MSLPRYILKIKEDGGYRLRLAGDPKCAQVKILKIHVLGDTVSAFTYFDPARKLTLLPGVDEEINYSVGALVTVTYTFHRDDIAIKHY